MISAAITPGTHPKKVRIKTIKIEPQPLSKTAKGGSRMDKRTRQKLILYCLFIMQKSINFFRIQSSFQNELIH